MCNACGFVCCGSDEFSGCGCNDCECEACHSEYDGDTDDYVCKVVNVGDKLHQILADALKRHKL